MKKLLFVLLFLIGCATTRQDISQDRGSRIIGLSLGEPIKTSKEIMTTTFAYMSYGLSGIVLDSSANQSNNNKNYFTVKNNIEKTALIALNSDLIDHKYEWQDAATDVVINQSARFHSAPSKGFFTIVDMSPRNRKYYNNPEEECKQFEQVSTIKDYDVKYRTYVLNKVACRKLCSKTWYVQKRFYKD